MVVLGTAAPHYRGPLRLGSGGENGSPGGDRNNLVAREVNLSGPLPIQSDSIGNGDYKRIETRKKNAAADAATATTTDNIDKDLGVNGVRSLNFISNIVMKHCIIKNKTHLYFNLECKKSRYSI